MMRKYFLIPLHGYPPDEQEKATQTVLEQAELLAKDSTREVLLERVIASVHQKPIADRIKERESSNIELKSSFMYDMN
jgi:Domain of unknown function (DUF3387)